MVDECPVCERLTRATRLSVATDRVYHVRRCPNCGLAFTVPRPTQSQLQSFYGEQYFKRTQRDIPFGYVDYEGESLAAMNADRTWDDLKNWGPQTSGVPVRRLLDIGAATGAFGARALGEGWRVVACEIGDSARKKAAEKGLVTVASLAEVEGPFGLITMFHVLEHVIEPLETLRRVRELVDSRGLVAIELPQWHSAGRLARQSRWAQLQPPVHINFFTASSLKLALERSGLAVVSSATPYPRASSLALDAIRKRQLRQAASQVARYAAGGAGFGGYLRVIARPR
jgi:hypothetical protein